MLGMAEQKHGKNQGSYEDPELQNQSTMGLTFSCTAFMREINFPSSTIPVENILIQIAKDSDYI
jgi:hypothetical protein